MHRSGTSIGAALLAGVALVAASSGPAQAAPSAQQRAQTTVFSQVGTSFAPSVAAASRPKVKAPARIRVHEFGDGKVTISWTRVKGIKKYEVHAYKIDPKLPGPYPFNVVPNSQARVKTTRLSYTFVNNFTPLKDTKRLKAIPWVITVASLAPSSRYRNSSAHSATITVKDRIVTKSVVIKVKPTATEKKKEKKIVDNCAVQGLAAGLGAASAQGLVALASVWIPGVNAVTWGSVVATSAAAGITTTLVCMVKDKISGDGVIVHVGRVVAV